MEKGIGRKIDKRRKYDQILVDVARVTRVVAGGRRFRFRATMVIGDRKGKVGMGVAKGADVTSAISKAVKKAEKQMFRVSIIAGTIPHEVNLHYSGATVFLKPASPGTGIIAGGGVRAVVELSGIKNILSKMLGSSNKINNVRATILALRSLKTPDEIAKMRGKNVSELSPFVRVEKKKNIRPNLKGKKGTKDKKNKVSGEKDKNSN
ncbi:MAG: 30S ribosomal protein S5 [uncultured bacterium]|nr:MAG: 30S ribosomal protein S5 [uncultured bacterium]